MATNRKEHVIAPPRNLIDSIKKAAFIIGSSLIVFTAARNTITWHVQSFWGATGDFWQRQFNWAYDSMGGSDFMVGCVATYLLTNLFYWPLGLLYILLDATGLPKFLMRYKIQPDKNAPLSKNDMRKGLTVVAFNTLIIAFPFLVCTYYAMRWRGCQFSGGLPTFQWVLLEIGVCILVEEIMFYYSHRLFHHPLLYKHIHKRHHEYTAPFGIVSLYAHPIEHIFSNLLPPAMGPILMGSHIATSWLWFCLALTSTLNSHSGYHFPFFPSPEAHDFHHLKFINNFGVLGVLDRLHGTDNLFRSSKAYERHLMMLSFIPPREMYPDDVKAKRPE